MNKILSLLLVLIYLVTVPTLRAQPIPKLKTEHDGSTAIKITWTNVVGTSYRDLFSTNLAQPLAVLEDAFSSDELVSVYALTTETPVGFFRIQVPTNTPATNVQIFSPSNSVTVSGEIAIRVGAQIGAQIQGVNLYLDDALVGYLNSGGMNFSLETTHFANGTHTIYVGAVDTANNETLSSAITLDFDNPVRWLGACSMFNSFVPIDVESDIYPADWLVSVTDTNGTIVRTITGSTTDGIIQTSWDGTDDNAEPLQVENLYQITVDVVETSESSSMKMGSSLLNSPDVSSKLTEQGVPEFTVQKPAPDMVIAEEKMSQIYARLTPQEKLIYPPLRVRSVSKSSVTTKTKLSARDMFLALHKNSGTILATASGTPSPNAASSSLAFGSTKTLAWWENPWSSKQTIVARVPISGTFGATVASDCNQIAALIGAADGTVGNNRGVFGTYVQLVNTSSDLTDMTNNLANSQVTALYFYGHGTTSGNGVGTTSRAIQAKDFADMFGNQYWPILPASYGAHAGKQALTTRKPFNFVFLDGCNTGKGDLPEAFGIPKAIQAADYDAAYGAHLHKRAYMGWSGPVVFQFDSAHIDWTLKFWSTWLDDSQAYSVTVVDAILAANSHRPAVPSSVPILRWGSRQLTWSD